MQNSGGVPALLALFMSYSARSSSTQLGAAFRVALRAKVPLTHAP
jgi:hypothetical protein